MDSCICEEPLPLPNFEEDVNDQVEEFFMVNEVQSLIDFGKVYVGGKAVKSFRMKNETMADQEFFIKTCVKTNPNYQLFNLSRYEAKVKPNQYFACKIIYKPLIPNAMDFDYFKIYDNNKNMYRICVKGQSVGPQVDASTKTLHFFKTPHYIQTTDNFEMKNLSEMEIPYQFDVNHNSQGIFTVDQIQGILKPNSYTYVRVNFIAKTPGYYCFQLPCLILFHEPIIIDLVGVYLDQEEIDSEKIIFTHYPWPLKDKSGFEGYMIDSVKISSFQPPVSISDNFLDFGRLLVSDEAKVQINGNDHSTLVTCLTNHMQTPIDVIWEKDNENIFEITPSQTTVPTEESVLFECHFRPDFAHKFFSKVMLGQVAWVDKRKSISELTFAQKTVPLTVTLRMIGHTFPENNCWIPSAELIPSKILLPPCIPYSLSCGTFMIKSKGHLPVLFKFLSPKKSNFIVKPMVGTIYNYQIFVVKLQPDTQKGKAYAEQWQVQLNGQEHRLLSVTIIGQLEWPSITVGKHNIITFPNIHPNCEEVMLVPMRNSTTYQIRYEFLIENIAYLFIDRSSGEICPNETLVLVWRLKGFYKMPQITLVKCELRPIENLKSQVGVPIDTQITVYAACVFSRLCAAPSCCNFGEIKWGTNLKTSFFLFNFGKSKIHFKLLCRQSFVLDEIAPEIEIFPNTGSVGPREKFNVNVSMVANKRGSLEFKLYYQVRHEEFSHVIINNGECFEIFTLSYGCVYPTLQIEDIAKHNFGPLFSKPTLWDMFRVDEFVLQSLINKTYTYT